MFLLHSTFLSTALTSSTDVSASDAFDASDDISIMTIFIAISIVAFGWGLGQLYLAIYAYVKRCSRARKRKIKHILKIKKTSTD